MNEENDKTATNELSNSYPLICQNSSSTMHSGGINCQPLIILDLSIRMIYVANIEYPGIPHVNGNIKNTKDIHCLYGNMSINTAIKPTTSGPLINDTTNSRANSIPRNKMMEINRFLSSVLCL